MSGGQQVPAELPPPAEVGGTPVLIGGFQAPLYFVSPGQINAQIPYELASSRKYRVIVVANGALTIPVSIQLDAVQPGIATFPDGLVIAQHPGLSLVSAGNPAAPGEFLVIYLAGLGKTGHPVVSGEACPANPLARPLDTPVPRLGGQQGRHHLRRSDIRSGRSLPDQLQSAGRRFFRDPGIGGGAVRRVE